MLRKTDGIDGPNDAELKRILIKLRNHLIRMAIGAVIMAAIATWAGIREDWVSVLAGFAFGGSVVLVDWARHDYMSLRKQVTS
jgi:hypothetical protein